MLSHRRVVARELRVIADDIATGDREIRGVAWYDLSHGDGVIPGTIADWKHRDVGRTPIVPMAIHDALCPALAVLIEDELEEIVVCDRCKLAVKTATL